jgi:hypothetical protein
MYMLRAIDHGHPLVNANDSFMSPLALEVERVTSINPDPERFGELLEQTPVSYVTVHNSLLANEQRLSLEKLLASLVATGQLKFIGSFPSAVAQNSGSRDDLYAVARVEPEAQRQPTAVVPEFLHLNAPPVVRPENLDPDAFAYYRMYRLSYGQRPTYDDFLSFIKTVPPEIAKSGKAEISSSYARVWTNRPEFGTRFNSMTDEQFINAVLQNAGLDTEISKELNRGSKETSSWRAEVLRQLANDKNYIAREVNPAFVVTHYFLYLHRDPDEGGFNFYLERLEKAKDYKGVNEAFANSPERK